MQFLLVLVLCQLFIVLMLLEIICMDIGILKVTKIYHPKMQKENFMQGEAMCLA